MKAPCPSCGGVLGAGGEAGQVCVACALAIALEASPAGADPPATLDLYAMGALAARRGDCEQALDWLTRAVEGGYVAPHGVAPMTDDEDLRSLRGDPRFEALAARARRQP